MLTLMYNGNPPLPRLFFRSRFAPGARQLSLFLRACGGYKDQNVPQTRRLVLASAAAQASSPRAGWKKRVMRVAGAGTAGGKDHTIRRRTIKNLECTPYACFVPGNYVSLDGYASFACSE